MNISVNYVVVEKLEAEEKEGFQTVEVQDNFICKGRVINLPAVPVYIGDDEAKIGDVILFSKYSPDTQDVDLDGKRVKFIKTDDILAIL